MENNNILTKEELASINKLFNESKGKVSEYIENLQEGEYDATIVSCVLHVSQKSGKVMFKIECNIEDMGKTSIYLCDMGNVTYVDRFKNLTEKLGKTGKNLETSISNLIGAEVKIIAKANKKGDVFASIVAR